MMLGDVLKYTPTSTVGKAVDIRDRDGKVWVKLDFTGLYYDADYLKTADPSEYKEVSYKERERNSATREGAVDALEDARKTEEEVDISGFTPSGGG
ncbi:MAG: DUF2098 domain-containing protein [Candidatus Methanoplasma sp.]|jgi:hypothetical protein|nr:DUF2098 domain-containing protein [Candidatus Methanoplasma sp.]